MSCPDCGHWQMIGPMQWYQGWVLGCPICKRLVKTDRNGDVE